MNKLGLITVLFNSDEVLEGFFKSLHIQTFQNYQLYIVDNSPSEKTNAIIEKLAKKYTLPSFTHICNIKNEGVAKANNIGINHALKNGCSHALLLNNDIEFHQPFLLEKLMDICTLKNEPLIIPKIFFYGTKKIWMAGGKLCKYNAVTHHIGEGASDSETYNKSSHYLMAPTCFMLIAKSVFEKIGKMDEDYFVYYDDTDFVYRATQQGFKVYYAPELEVYHKVSSSTGGRQSSFSIYFWNRNRIFFVKKNMAFLYKTVAFGYILSTTIIKLFLYKGPSRQALLKGVKDGFKYGKK